LTAWNTACACRRRISGRCISKRATRVSDTKPNVAFCSEHSCCPPVIMKPII